MMQKIVFALCCMLIATHAFAQQGFTAATERGVQDQYVVVLEEHVARRPGEDVPGQPDVPEAAEFLTGMFGGKVVRSWEHALQGFLVTMPEQAARALARHPWVASVSQDEYVDPEEVFAAPVDDCFVKFDTPPGTGYSTNARALPWFSPQASLSCADPDPQSGTTCIDNWGIDRIDQASVNRNQSYSFADRGTGIHVYVMDSGIRADHREFKDRFGASRVVGGTNFVFAQTGDTSATTTDCHGHGTHVAGIIGGRTYGAAKDVLLHPVRVICDSQASPVSNWISGLDWIRQNHDPATEGTAVVNWSGGNGSAFVYNGGVYANLRTAVYDLAAVPTLLLVQSAGNHSGNHGTYTPYDACHYSFGNEARYSGTSTYDAARSIFVVGGSDEDDGRWTRRAGDPRFSKYCGSDCGSNVGTCVDLFAPAAHVVSASNQHSAGYCRLSGTSMSAPHAAGVAARYLQRNRLKTSQQVKDELVGQATTGALQTSTSHPNYIGSGSPNKLLSSQLPAVTCGVDRTLTTTKNTRLTFYASQLRGSGCVSGDWVWARFDQQFGTLTYGGIGIFDILYYYDPPANWTGTDTFHYDVEDSTGKIKAVGMVKVVVTP